jgi:WD40 repeat protein
MHYKKMTLVLLFIHLYTQSADYTLLNPVETCPKVNTLNVANYIQHIAFDSLEQQFATTSYDQAKVWYIKGKTFTDRTHTFETQPCYFNDVHFVSEFDILTAEDNGNAVLRNLTAQTESVFNHPQEGSPQGLPSVFSAQANNDKTDIVTATNGYAAIWDIKTEARKHTLKHDDKTVIAAIFSSDGSQVATAAENFVHLWDAKNGHHISSFKNEKKVKSITFAPNGLSLIAAVGNMAKIWSIGESKIVDEIEIDKLEEQDPAYGGNNVTGVEYHPDGKQLLTTSFHRTIPWYQMGELRPSGDFYPKVKIWDINTKECLHISEDRDYPYYLKFAQFTPSGDNIAIQRRLCDTVIDLYNIRGIIGKK